VTCDTDIKVSEGHVIMILLTVSW